MMQTYAKVRNLETLLALCMSSKAETYHHWKVFADKSNGVCIHFHKAPLIAAMTQAGVSVRNVEYLTFGELDPKNLAINQLPYLKRIAFIDEGEVRAVYENKEREQELKRVPIGMEVIERITLNPWMPQSIVDSIKNAIGSMTKDAPFDIARSNLIDSKTWRKFAASYEKPDLA